MASIFKTTAAGLKNLSSRSNKATQNKSIFRNPGNRSRGEYAANILQNASSTSSRAEAAEEFSLKRSMEKIGNNSTPSEEVSDELVEFAKKKEGFSPTPYWDVNQWSIGYGTRSSKNAPSITEQEAEKLLKNEYAASRREVFNALKEGGYERSDFSNREIDMLTSFTHNLGAGSPNDFGKTTGGKGGVRRLLLEATDESGGVGARYRKDGVVDKEAIAEKMLEFSTAGGKSFAGLEKRRMEEASAFLGESFEGGEGEAGQLLSSKTGKEFLAETPDSINEAPSEVFRTAAPFFADTEEEDDDEGGDNLFANVDNLFFNSGPTQRVNTSGFNLDLYKS